MNIYTFLLETCASENIIDSTLNKGILLYTVKNDIFFIEHNFQLITDQRSDSIMVN